YFFGVGNHSAQIVDLPTVLIHEIGHAQGLAHTPVTSAVMWSTSGRGDVRRALTADDVSGLCEIYPTGRTATCDPQPSMGFSCGPEPTTVAPSSCQCRAAAPASGAAHGPRRWLVGLCVLVLAVAGPRQRVSRRR
ncbi:MAG: matrixin family metalloprotease, partial [Deltaproteobacteria bacterium]